MLKPCNWLVSVVYRKVIKSCMRQVQNGRMRSGGPKSVANSCNVAWRPVKQVDSLFAACCRLRTVLLYSCSPNMCGAREWATKKHNAEGEGGGRGCNNLCESCSFWKLRSVQDHLGNFYPSSPSHDSADQPLEGFNVDDLRDSKRIRFGCWRVAFSLVVASCRAVHFVVYVFVFADGDQALQNCNLLAWDVVLHIVRAVVT